MGEIIDSVAMTSDYPESLLDVILCELEENYNRVGFITKIYVDTPDRGKGIGKHLLSQYMERIFPNTEIDFLFARHENEQLEGFDLIEFYKKIGFAEVRGFCGEMLMVTKGHETYFKKVAEYWFNNCKSRYLYNQ
jgi:GNAT superfamily N-acetyltransferase